MKAQSLLKFIATFVMSLLLIGIFTPVAVSDTHALQEATNLASDGAQAKREKRLVVLMISQEHCEFCEQIKAEILNPMIKSGSHKDSLLIRELFIDFDIEVIDFQGEKRPAHEVADDYGITFTPTMLFLNGEGKSLVDPIIGLSTPELYPFYLDRSIQEAIAVLHKSANM